MRKVACESGSRREGIARLHQFCRIDEKVSRYAEGGHPLHTRLSGVASCEAGEAFAFHTLTPTGATVSDDLVPSTRSEEAKRGITIGILVVALICLSLFFLWRHYGIAGAAGSETHAGASTTP
jgi:hypothetical protein